MWSLGTKIKIKEINPEQTKNGSNLFQSSFWAKFKESRGYDTQAFNIDYNGKNESIIMVLRPCAADALFGYLPYGPDISVPQDQQGRFLEFVSEGLREYLPYECRFIRYDLPWQSPYVFRDNRKEGYAGVPEPRIRELRMNFGTRNWNLRKSPTDMQPSDTVVLDLFKSTPRILQDMHQKTRYCIRNAFRRGVLVERKGPESLPLWHRIYLDMAERKGLVCEDLDYFREMFDTARHCKPEVMLYMATRNGKSLAGSIIAHQGSTAYYLFSAASLYGRKLTASYAVLWKAIMTAKLRGDRWFDFFGIPPTDDPSHPMYGLYKFKTRFGGITLHLRGCWDYPLDDDLYHSLALSSAIFNPAYRYQ